MNLKALGSMFALLVLTAGPLVGCSEEKHTLEICPDTQFDIDLRSYTAFTLTDQYGVSLPVTSDVVSVDNLKNLKVDVFYAGPSLYLSPRYDITLSWQVKGDEPVTALFDASADDPESFSGGELISNDSTGNVTSFQQVLQYKKSDGELRVLKGNGDGNTFEMINVDLQSYHCELSCGQEGGWAECHERHCDYKCDNGLSGKFNYSDGCEGPGDESALLKQLPPACQINGITPTDAPLVVDVPVKSEGTL